MKSNFSKTIYWILFIFYDLVLVKLIVFRRSPSYVKSHLLDRRNWKILRGHGFHGNLTPFHTIRYYLSGNENFDETVLNLLGNFLGFVPLGFFLSLLIIRTRSVLSIMIITFFTSLSFEIIQLITGLGFFDVDDLILNTLGGICGYFIFRILEHLQQRKLKF